MSLLGYAQDPNDYSFSIAGRRVLVNVVDTAMPTSIVPITSLNLPSGWTDLGAVENGEVNITVSRQTEAIQTGVVPTDRRKYITGQEGSIEANFQFYEPRLIGYQAGVDPETDVAAAGADRGYTDIVIGGTLGDILSFLCFEDFDIPLVQDDGLKTYEQVWHYSPKIQGDGDINLSQKINKAPAVAFRAALLGFAAAAAPDRTAMLIQRWVMSA